MMTKPVLGLIKKIDPSKPLNKLKLTVDVKRTGNAGYIVTGTRMHGMSGGVGAGEDPTYTKAYHDVLENVKRDNRTGGGQNQDFFVSQRDTGVGMARRQGVNMGDIGGIEPVEDIEEEDNLGGGLNDSQLGNAGYSDGENNDRNDGNEASDEDLMNDLGGADDDAPNLVDMD